MAYSYDIWVGMTFSADPYAEDDGYKIEEEYYVFRGEINEMRMKFEKKIIKTRAIRLYTRRDKIPLSEQKRIITEIGEHGGVVGVIKIKERDTIPPEYIEYPKYKVNLKKGEVIIKPRKKKENEIWKWNKKLGDWEFITYEKERRKLVGYERKKLKNRIEGTPGYIDIIFDPYVKTKRIKTKGEIFYTLDYQKETSNKGKNLLVRFQFDIIIGIKPEKGKEMEWIDKVVEDIENYLTIGKCRELLAIMDSNLDYKNSSNRNWFNETLGDVVIDM